MFGIDKSLLIKKKLESEGAYLYGRSLMSSSEEVSYSVTSINFK